MLGAGVTGSARRLGHGEGSESALDARLALAGSSSIDAGV